MPGRKGSIAAGPNGRQIEYGQGNIHPVLPAMGDVELRLREMDQQGIDVAVLSINIPGGGVAVMQPA